MNIVAIIKKFCFALPLLAAFSVSAATAVVTSDDGVEIRFENGNREQQQAADELRALDRAFCAFFRVSAQTGGSVRLVIQLNDAIPPGELGLRRTNSAWELAFAADNSWKSNIAMRRRIFGALLLTKLPARHNDAGDRMPGWIVAGFDERRRAAAGPERLLRRNRHLPVTSALLELGAFPDFREMMKLEPEQLSDAARLWYGELSRVLLEAVIFNSSAVDNALLDYAVLLTRPEASEEQSFAATVGRVLLAGAKKNAPSEQLALPEARRLQLYLENFAAAFAWHEYAPRPTRLARENFEKAAKLTLPVSDRPDGPSGATVTADLAELPALLISGRPDATELRNDTASRLRELRAGNDAAHNRLLAELTDSLQALPVRQPDPPTSLPAARFLTALKELRRYYATREAVELMLENVERSTSPPVERYRARITEAIRPAPLLTADEKKFFDRIEALYLDD